MSHVHVLAEEVSDRSNASRGVVGQVDLILGIISPSRSSFQESTARNDLPDQLVTLLREALDGGVPVITILIRGATLPVCLQAASLPPVSVVELRHDRWGQDVRTVVDEAERLLAGLAARPRQVGERVHVASAAATLAGSLESARRRYIPHDRTWRFLLRIAGMLGGLLLLAIAVVAYRWHALAPIRQVESSTRRLAEAGATDVAKTALEELQRIVASSKDPGIENLAARRLRAIVLDKSARGANSRQIRLLALSGIQTLRRNDITKDFMANELIDADLGGARLSGVILRGVNLKSARLAGAVLDRADLSGSDLSAAFIAHASVHGAKFVGADFTALDWFNAAGFTDAQLSSVTRATLERCPTDTAGAHSVKAFELRFDDEYTGGYKALSKSMQDWLSRVWDRYRASGGMCEAVDRLMTSRK